jgi:hypothetical protein
MDDLSKDIEAGRAARRAKAQALVASGWTPPAPPKPAPKPRKQTAAQARKELEARAKLVDDLLAEAERATAECVADMGVQDIDAYHDIAQSLALQIEHVADRKDFYRRAGILPALADRELAGWDWMDA